MNEVKNLKKGKSMFYRKTKVLITDGPIHMIWTWRLISQDHDFRRMKAQVVIFFVGELSYTFSSILVFFARHIFYFLLSWFLFPSKHFPLLPMPYFDGCITCINSFRFFQSHYSNRLFDPLLSTDISLHLRKI